MVTRNQPRGAESAAVALAEALTQRGYETRVVALAPGPGAEVPGVHVLGRRTLGPGTLLRLRGEVAGADVVVAHGSRTLPAVVIASGGRVARFVYQNIGDPLYWAGRGWRLRWVRFLLARTSMVAALTERSEQVLRDHFAVPAERVRTIRNFRDGRRFTVPTEEERRAARVRWDVSPGDRVVGVIGALSPEKRVDLAVRAATLTPGTTVLVAGEGPRRAALEELAVRHDGRVRLLGSLPDVVGLLHACDALLMTSESEGVPGVLIEAGLCGVPAVSTDVGYVSDVVEDGVTGRLVGSSSADEIGAALEAVLQDRDRMGAAARSRCLERFELQRVLDEWQCLLGALLNGRPGRPSR